MTEVERKPTWQTREKPKRRPRGRPKGYRIVVRPLEQITAIKLRLALPDEILTFRDVAEELSRRAGKHVGLGTIHRFIMRGIEPNDPVVRQVLGLPEIVKMPVCPACGVVHTKSCPNRPKPPRKPRTDWRGRALRAEAGLRRVTGI